MQTLGFNHYALTSHLGNVLSVVTDNINISPDSAFAKIVAATDYYAFGSEIPGRTYSGGGQEGYRYGFNGKEKDTENTWGDTSYDYGFRIYNPRYGRFLSVDPLTQSYPWYTPYQFAGNTPIQAIDLDGLEPNYVRNQWTYRRQPWLSQAKSPINKASYSKVSNYKIPPGQQGINPPRNRPEFDYIITPTNQPHRLNPQYTPNFQGSGSEFVVNVFRGVNEIRKFVELLRVDVELIETYDVGLSDFTTNRKSKYYFYGSDALKLYDLQSIYERKVEEHITAHLNLLSNERLGKDFQNLNQEDKLDFVFENEQRVMLIKIEATQKYGPSPFDQVIMQLEKNIQEGNIIKIDNKPELLPILKEKTIKP